MQDKEIVDPIDAPPEREPLECTGEVISSNYVKTPAEAEAVEAGMGERYEKFVEQFKSDNNLSEVQCLLVRVKADDRIDKDTRESLVFSQLVRVIDKNGNFLRTGQAPDIYGTQFREITGKSVSPNAVGTPTSVVGSGLHVHFVEYEAPLGRGWKKNFRLWPEGVRSAEQVAALPVQEIDRSTTDETADVEGASAVPTLSEDEAVAKLQEVLLGKTPGQMLQTILDEPALSTVGTVLGVPLMAAATDETLAQVLDEKGILKVNGAGQFEAVPA
jgi:hypothetical protein